ncbi:MAG: hypothetical protein JW901_01765 [Dehalococcoidia bacterium]|nr:hypothetical protein [Dehalococcoidia bacterium]
MEADDKIRLAIENTMVLRPPRQQLATFGITNVYYYMITELMNEVNVVREGRVIAARPKIVTPTYLINIEGFSGPAKRFIQMAAEQNPHEPGILYSYKNETGEMNIVSEPLVNILDKINKRIDNRNDPLSAIIKGVEELWDVSLMKFTFELTRNSAYRNFSELYGRGRLVADNQGVPRDARENIEELFEMAAKDPSYAPELVSELHRWKLWSTYQDRFLNLFKRY